MKMKLLKNEFSVCKINDYVDLNICGEYVFLSRTPDEVSLVCESDKVPNNVVIKEAGWRAFKIDAVLDFSLIGIIARISRVLAEGGIGIFVVSTYDTDYVLVKSFNLEIAIKILSDEGFEVKSLD